MDRLSRSYARAAARLALSPVRFTFYLLLASLVASTTLLVRSASSRDPGSWFFDPDVAYNQQYSAVRHRQAERFVATADSSTIPYPQSGETPGICIGMPSIARDDASYLRTSVGSLLAGLHPEERAGIHLIVFIPHTDPAVHPAYAEAWLSHLADEVLLYNLSSQQELEYVKSLERVDVEHRTKGLYDYTYLLKACYAAGTPYIAIVEDDVLAMDGWYHRTVDGIRRAERASADFLYLRLFYTEKFLGWNSEYWQSYAFWSILVVTVFALLVDRTRSTFPPIKRILTSRLSLAIPFLLVPWGILLYFAAGRATVLPLRTESPEWTTLDAVPKA